MTGFRFDAFENFVEWVPGRELTEDMALFASSEAETDKPYYIQVRRSGEVIRTIGHRTLNEFGGHTWFCLASGIGWLRRSDLEVTVLSPVYGHDGGGKPSLDIEDASDRSLVSSFLMKARSAFESADKRDLANDITRADEAVLVALPDVLERESDVRWVREYLESLAADVDDPETLVAELLFNDAVVDALAGVADAIARKA